MKTRFLMPLLAALALVMTSCENKVVPDIPKPVVPDDPAPEVESVWINDCPAGFALNTETRLYAQFSGNVPTGYHADLRSSDESVIRISPGASGWDFYVTAVSLGSAKLTLEYNGLSAEYTIETFQKVVPTLYVTKDYVLMCRFVASNAPNSIEINGKLSMEMQGAMAVKARYMNDQVFGKAHGYETDIVQAGISATFNDVPMKEPFVIADLSSVKRALDDGIQSNSWEEDLMYGDGGFYYFWMEDYYPEYFDIRYDCSDREGNKIAFVMDYSAIKGDGWKDSHVHLEHDESR